MYILKKQIKINNTKESSTKDLPVGIWDVSKWDECV